MPLPSKRAWIVSLLRPANGLEKVAVEEKVQLLLSVARRSETVRPPALIRTATRPRHAVARLTPGGRRSEPEVVKRYGRRRASLRGVTRAVSRPGRSRPAAAGGGGGGGSVGALSAVVDAGAAGAR